MKKLTLSLILSMPWLCQAGIKIPSGVFTANQVEAAAADAVKNKKALAFILSDSKTDCSICNAKTMETIKKFDSHSVVVFIDQIDPAKWHQVSPVVPTALYDPKLGNIIPRAVITSPEMLQVIAVLSEDDMEKNSNYSEAKKSVSNFLNGVATPRVEKNLSYRWPTTSNGFYVGTFEGIKEEKSLVLGMNGATGGVSVEIPFTHLSKPSADFAKLLAGSNPSPTESKVESHTAQEAWTSSNGKTLQAKFVSLENNMITLEMADGKSHTLPMDRLDPASQEKARARSSGRQ